MDRARACLVEIVDLYESGPDANGPELLERVTDLFFVTTKMQSAEDRKAFGDVMERMVYAADPITRANFAERIARAELAPVDLIRRLAKDEIFIARPILQYSPGLREGDLVSLSRNAEQAHLKATAHRKHLTKPVTDILVKRGDLGVLQAVVGNAGAEFSAEALDQLSRAAEIHGELQPLLSLRRDLAPRVITRLKRLTEYNFWQQMAETMLMTSEEPDKKDSPKPKTPKVALKDKAPESKAGQPAKPENEEKISGEGPETEMDLAGNAKASKVDETIESFAAITGLDKMMVEHCLFQAHISALMVLCKAHGFAPGTFTALLQIRENITKEPTDDAISLMRRYENMTEDTAKRIISFSDKRPNGNKNEAAQANAPGSGP